MVVKIHVMVSLVVTVRDLLGHTVSCVCVL
jgi:hypothetical protein